MPDQDIEYVWHDAPVPAGLPVTQVYGWLLCPVAGRALIQEQDDGTFTLPTLAACRPIPSATPPP
jgi:8-oxo-dGTP diphosphatase